MMVDHFIMKRTVQFFSIEKNSFLSEREDITVNIQSGRQV